MRYPEHRYTGPKPWMNKEWLYEEYVVKDRSSKDIAEEYGCVQNVIQDWLIRHHIKKQINRKKIYRTYEYLYQNYIVLHRGREEIAKENNVSWDSITDALRKNKIQLWDKKVNTQYPFSKEDEEDIIDRYVNQKQSSTVIAKAYNKTHRSILNCLEKNGIERRILSESQFAYNNKEFISELNDKELLNSWHWEQNLSCKDIGKILGCDGSTVRHHMQSLGLKTKNDSESKMGQMTGKNHPNWQGGISPLNTLLREYLRIHIIPIAVQRDNYTCCECGKKHTDINVHHIYPFADIMRDIYTANPDLDPTKEEDSAILYDIAIHNEKFLDIDNLQTLCVDCHHKKHSKTISNQADDDFFSSEGSETI